MLLTRSFTFTLFLSFIFCSLVGAKDTSNPFIYNLTKFLPSIVWNDDSPVSQTTSLLAGLARDRIPDGYKKGDNENKTNVTYLLLTQNKNRL